MMRFLLISFALISLNVMQGQKSEGFKFDKDLILYLPLNGNVNDLSPLKNICFAGIIKPEIDKNNNVNGAFSFEENGWIAVDEVENFNRLSAFTLSSWIYINNYAEHNNIISKVNPGRDFNLQVMEDGRLNFHTYNNGYIHFCSILKLPLHKWIHVAFTYDGNMFNMYINGKPQKFSINERNNFVEQKDLKFRFLWTGTDLTIGNLYPSGGENFRGRIDEVRIYKKALSDVEVSQLYGEKSKTQNVVYILENFDQLNTEPPLKSIIIDDGVKSPNDTINLMPEGIK